jgi:hypothetical protein
MSCYHLHLALTELFSNESIASMLNPHEKFMTWKLFTRNLTRSLFYSSSLKRLRMNSCQEKRFEA